MLDISYKMGTFIEVLFYQEIIHITLQNSQHICVYFNGILRIFRRNYFLFLRQLTTPRKILTFEKSAMCK